MNNLVHTRMEEIYPILQSEVARIMGGRYAPEDVEDVIQEAVVALLSRDSPANDGVVLGSAKFAVLKFLSKKSPNEVLESELGASVEEPEELKGEEGAEAHHSLTVVTTETPETLLMQEDLWNLLWGLPDDAQLGVIQAYKLVELDGIGTRRAARQLNVSRSTVRRWVREGRNYLLKELRANDVSV